MCVCVRVRVCVCMCVCVCVYVCVCVRLGSNYHLHGGSYIGECPNCVMVIVKETINNRNKMHLVMAMLHAQLGMEIQLTIFTGFTFLPSSFIWFETGADQDIHRLVSTHPEWEVSHESTYVDYAGRYCAFGEAVACLGGMFVAGSVVTSEYVTLWGTKGHMSKRKTAMHRFCTG